jgi:hypothetical protein
MEDADVHSRSLARLHDDELSCVLPFLSLPDLSQWVRCSRRFNSLARKERSRGLHVEGDAEIVPSLLSSTLGHHIISLDLGCHDSGMSAVTRAALNQLRSLKLLPQLTALELRLVSIGTGPDDDATAAASLQSVQTVGLPDENAVAALQAALPTQLHSFKVSLNIKDASNLPGAPNPPQLLFPALVASLPVMQQLSELSIECELDEMPLEVRLEVDVLTQLPHLRTLNLLDVRWTYERLTDLKPLSSLRELNTNLTSHQLIQLCHPPHALQLECIHLGFISVDKTVMSALLHLPTLTELQPKYLRSDAWPLLPQLPMLRRLTVPFLSALSDARATLLATSLSGCRVLIELELGGIAFEEADGEDATSEQQRARWTDILHSVPLVQRFTVDTRQALSLLAVLPEHLPQLVHLKLSTSVSASEVVASLAHPTVQEVELVRSSSDQLDASQVQRLVGNPRLPRLVRCTCSQS